MPSHNPPSATAGGPAAAEALDSIRAGCTAYLDLLDTGMVDDRADELMRSLVGVSLPTVTAPEASRIAATCEALAELGEARSTSATNTPTMVSDAVLVDDPRAYAPTASRRLSTSTDQPWTSWLTYARNEGDQLVCLGPQGEAAMIGRGAAVVNRQVIDATPDTAWLVTSRREGSDWRLEAVEVTAAGSGTVELIAPAEAVNPDVCVSADGVVHVVYQQVIDGRFVVVHVQRDKNGWSQPVPVSAPDETAWDPSVAVHGDTVSVVWSTHRDSRFRLCLRQRNGTMWRPEVVAPLGADGHGLHGSISAGIDGTWWVVCDVIGADTLATSGRTAAVRSEALGTDTHQFIPAYDLTTRIEVLHYDGHEWTRPTGPVVTERSSGSYPRVAQDAAGRLWLGYRTLRQLPFRHYVAHVAVRVHCGQSWSEPRLAPHSDGTNAEFSVVSMDSGVMAVYHGDAHQERFRAMLAEPEQAAEQLNDTRAETVRREHLMLPALDRMATGGHLGHGRVHRATFDHTSTASPGLEPVQAAQPSVPTRRPAPAGWAPPGEDGTTQRLWWGDLHRHSNISRCGAGLDIGVDDHYRLAEDVMGCDFWALTDHAENTSDLNWHHLRKLANAFYRPGAHVPLIGFEWTSFTAGHMNVIYAGDDGPLFSSSDPQTSTPDGLWTALEGHEALTIPHHPAALVYATDWSYRSEKFLRLVEVFQAATGSYESPWCPRQYHDAVAPGATVHDALAAGHRLGFIASTDHRSGAAYLGVYAATLDRPSIHAALTDRRCFGATRRGIVPHLRIGEAWPGQSTPLSAITGPVQFAGSGIGSLSTVQLLRNGEIVADARPTHTEAGDLIVPIDVHMLSDVGGQRNWSGSLQVRGAAHVEQADHWAPEVRRVDESSVSWSVELPARYGGRVAAPGVVNVGVTVIGAPDAMVLIEAGGRRIATTLADLMRQVRGAALSERAGSDTLSVRCGVGGLGSLGAQIWEGTASADLLESGCWYYVRVIQSDGEMAWSSPIWVD